MTKTTISVYRIFLSSTAIDLQEHRQKVSDAILRLGDLLVAMETFGARPNEPVDLCRQKVRDCDALVVMVPHRYGWVPGPDRSRHRPEPCRGVRLWPVCHRSARAVGQDQPGGA